MSRAVCTYKGVKYSLQPHGLKSKLLIWTASFVAAFGGALLLSSPADGAPPAGSVFVTVCGNSNTWYVNSDETSRAPLATSDGLVFSPADLIHHEANLAVSSLQPGTFVASPAPDQPSFFSVEVVSDAGAYGTLRWDGTQWSITIGPGGGATAGTFTDVDPVALLAGRVTKWGAFDPATNKVISFGVGYTQNPPGTKTTLVSKISFQGTDYVLACAAPTVTVNVSGPTVTITKNQTVTVQVPAPTQSASATPSPSPSPTPTLSPSTSAPGVIPTFSPAAGSGSGGGMNGLLPWAFGVVALTAGGLITAGVVKRRRANAYQAAHSINNADTQLIPAYPGDDDYGVADYDPNLGGYSGESWRSQYQAPDNSATVEIPPASEETTPADSDTEQIAPPEAPPATTE